MTDVGTVIPRASRPFESPMTLAVRNSRVTVAPDTSLRPAGADEAEADPAQAVTADPSVIDAERHPLYGHGVERHEKEVCTCNPSWVVHPWVYCAWWTRITKLWWREFPGVNTPILLVRYERPAQLSLIPSEPPLGSAD